MKITLILLMLMCNAIGYGQSYYMDSLPVQRYRKDTAAKQGFSSSTPEIDRRFYALGYVKALDSFKINFETSVVENAEEILGNKNYELHDSVWIRPDLAYMMFTYFKKKPNYIDSVLIFRHPIDTGMRIFDSVTIYGNDPPVYHRKKDTLRVLCQVIDTTHEYSLPSKVDSVSIDSDSPEINYWVKGKQIKPFDYGIPTKLESYFTFLYSVREQEQPFPDCSKCWPSWKHLYYLDSEKKELNKNIIVWQETIINK